MHDHRIGPESGTGTGTGTGTRERSRGTWSSARRVATAGALLLVASAGASCIQRGYPLGPSGEVDVRLDVSGPLYAAADVDANGAVVGARQQPYSTGVTLQLTEEGDPAFGAYVDVRVEPAEALELSSSPDEQDPTCTAKDGAFRCMATREGFARFVATSKSTWSGDAKLVVSWTANAPKEQTITINQAGLPADVQNFEMIVGGISGSADQARIPATFVKLACTVHAKPDTPGVKWPAGLVRAREAHVRVTPPAGDPRVVENAPVLVEALDSEGVLSLDPGCGDADRQTRLPLVLDDTGGSPTFYLCFSDLGGTVRYAISSASMQTSRELVVDPEPYLLRVKTLQSDVVSGLGPQPLFEVDAFDLTAAPMRMKLDLAVVDPATEQASNVLQLDPGQTTVDTADAEQSPTTITVVAPNPGTAQLRVTPILLTKPACKSDIVTVEQGTFP